MVQSGLLTFGTEEAPVSQIAQYSRALHGGLKPLEQALAIFSFMKPHE
jgi:hypothetical protein